MKIDPLTHSDVSFEKLKPLMIFSLNFYLLNLCCCGSEQLNISWTDYFFVFEKRFLPLCFLSEQNERVSSGSAIRFFDKKNSILLVKNITGFVSGIEEINLHKI